MNESKSEALKAKSGHKDEALRAIGHVVEALAGPEPIEGLRRHQLRAALEFAQEQISRIQALKRARRAAEAPPEAP